ncbi:ABC transporter permease [Actinophytocola algeriensis]|uniref:Peptide/nickel transport system permease protein n=1 Tax=Actinophytocola algeriensis TaxID=1768010 RepID=A0A7W7VF86_9PSEU|nr:ABC transporter permease [Actinophytocola algeriensis]MBB4907904.1 peptide/nickel transport system permease protein [Actinophytocola algeriensis]MBE1479934.1 peptide/nickel transport system permease protein [Actinophytocola algeriensis]
MGAYLVRRVLVSVLVLVLVSIGIFWLFRLAPGDPVEMMLPPQNRGPGSEAFIAAKRAELGLDEPVWVQYFTWLGNAVTGDLGYSLDTGRSVSDLLGERVGPTVYLMGLSLLLALVIAVPLGLLAAVRKGRFADYAASVVSLGAVCTPPFFLGILGIYVFSLKLGLLPSAGMSTPGQYSVGDSLSHLLMPLVILAFSQSGQFTRYVRSSVIAELHADYVRTAEAKGVSATGVVTRHVLRNALIPVITIVALSLPNVLAGAVVIETVFAWPGMGQLAIASFQGRDYPVIIGFALFFSIMVLLSNLIADLLYTLVDPRVSLR